MWKVFEHDPFCCTNTAPFVDRVPFAAFPTKLPSASLNLSTYIARYTYGYRNIYELGPQLDPEHATIPFESTSRFPPAVMQSLPPPTGAHGSVGKQYR